MPLRLRRTVLSTSALVLITGVVAACGSGAGEDGDPKTLVIATHDFEIARRWCTRAIRLNAGRIVADEPVDEVLAAMEAAPPPPPTAEVPAVG